jgi:hypothetical protein
LTFASAVARAPSENSTMASCGSRRDSPFGLSVFIRANFISTLVMSPSNM